MVRKWAGAAMAAILATGVGVAAQAADAKDPNAVVDRGIQALGGAEKLGKAKGFSWTGKGTISFGGNDNSVTTRSTIQDISHYRQELDGDFGGNAVHAVTVVSGDKGWRAFGDNRQALENDGLAAERRRVYLELVPVTLLPLKDKAFKLESVAGVKVNDKDTDGVKVTPPDGKDFTIYFDQTTGLPARLVAKVRGFQGGEFTQETTFSDYREVDGVKKAMKIVSTRDGEKFIETTLSDFKVLDQVDPKTFDEPQ